MSKLSKLHAAALNTLARIFGVGAIIAGGGCTIWGLVLVLDSNATIDVNGVPTRDPWEKVMTLVAGLVVAAMGILMLKAKPYQPEE